MGVVIEFKVLHPQWKRRYYPPLRMLLVPEGIIVEITEDGERILPRTVLKNCKRRER